MLRKVAAAFGVLLLLFVAYLYVQAVRSGGSQPPTGAANPSALSSLVTTKATPPMTLKPCPDTPNCVSTQAIQPKKKRDPIPFLGTAEETKRQLKKVIEAMPRTALVKEEGNYLHYTFRTWPIPFTDDVEFIIDPEEKVIHYRSASRVGKSDLGVNSGRMAKVVAAFAAGYSSTT